MIKIYQKNAVLCKNSVKGGFGGFTLMELLAVVLIIGIIAAVAWPKYEAAVLKSKAVQALVLLRNTADAQTRYYMTNGHYTEDLSLLDIELPQSSKFTLSYMERCDWGNATITVTVGWHLYFTYHPIPFPCSVNKRLEGVTECVARHSSKNSPAGLPVHGRKTNVKRRLDCLSA